MMSVKFEKRENGWYWIYYEFFDGPFLTQQDAFLDCQSFVEYKLDEMTEAEYDELENEDKK
jgi:hypothetical protein